MAPLGENQRKVIRGSPARHEFPATARTPGPTAPQRPLYPTCSVGAVHLHARLG